jgi:hypothetical protein
LKVLSISRLSNTGTELATFKTKKKRSNRRAADNELHDNEMMDVEEAIVPRIRNLDANFVDDDELQAALARSRQAKLLKTKKLSPEELAKKSGFVCFHFFILSYIVWFSCFGPSEGNFK